MSPEDVHDERSKWRATFDQEERAAWDRYVGDAHIAWASMAAKRLQANDDRDEQQAHLMAWLEEMAINSGDVLLAARRERFRVPEPEADGGQP